MLKTSQLLGDAGEPGGLLKPAPVLTVGTLSFQYLPRPAARASWVSRAPFSQLFALKFSNTGYENQLFACHSHLLPYRSLREKTKFVFLWLVWSTVSSTGDRLVDMLGGNERTLLSPSCNSTAWFATFLPAVLFPQLPVRGAVVGDAGCSDGEGSAGMRLAGRVGAP